MTESAITQLPLPGGTVALERRGRRGPTLVFLHYWGGSARTWHKVVGQLPADQDVVLFDQRGWGRSRALPGPYGLDRLAADVIGVAEGLELDSYVLVGHSMGAKVCQIAAARHPVGLAGVALVAPAPAKPPALLTAGYRFSLAHAYDSPQTVELAIDHALTATALDPATRNAVVHDSLAADDAARREWPLEGIAVDIAGLAVLIDVPVLVLAAQDDRVEPPHVLRENLLPYLRNARFEVIARSGHLLPLEAPEAVAAALARFASGLGG
jgi:pimeloyl-ACP methyl ester carboxylesterase